MSVLDGDAVDVAPRLLGAVLRVRGPAGTVGVRLTEVEAYRGEEDPGSHAFRGRTRRNATMFGPPAHLYVYFTYGMHWCANVVCGPADRASAVLLRAGEVVEGLELARARRPAARRDVDLARGPARLCQALGVDGHDDGALVDVVGAPPGRARPPAGAGLGSRVELTVGAPAARVATGPRVGVVGAGGDAGAFPWRFWMPDEPTVSSYRAGGRSRRVERGLGGGTAD